MGHICQKMFFENSVYFLQNSAPVRILMLYVIFNIFNKMSNFCQGGQIWTKLSKMIKMRKTQYVYKIVFIRA